MFFSELETNTMSDIKNSTLIRSFCSLFRFNISNKLDISNKELNIAIQHDEKFEFGGILQLLEDLNIEIAQYGMESIKFGDFYGMCVYLAYHIKLELNRFKIAKFVSSKILSDSFDINKYKKMLDLVTEDYDFELHKSIINYIDNICVKAVSVLNVSSEYDHEIVMILNIFNIKDEETKIKKILSYKNIINSLYSFKNEKIKECWAPKDFLEFIAYILDLLHEAVNNNLEEDYDISYLYNFHVYFEDLENSKKELLNVKIPTFFVSDTHQITFNELKYLLSKLDELSNLDIDDIPDFDSILFEKWSLKQIREFREKSIKIDRSKILISPREPYLIRFLKESMIKNKRKLEDITK